MPLYTLYTYIGLEQLRQIQQEKEIVPFIFGKTKECLDANPNIYVDISSLIYLLQVNKENQYSAYVNLLEIIEDTNILVEYTLAADTLDLLPHLFSTHIPFYDEEKLSESENYVYVFKNIRRQIYNYNNEDDLTAIIAYANEHNIPIATFSHASGNLKKEFETLNKSVKLALLDLTSVSYAIEDNKNLIYVVEQLLNAFSNIQTIALTSQIDIILKYFPLYFEGQQGIKDLLPGLGVGDSIDKIPDEIKKITSLSDKELNHFIDNFDYYLIGHNYFKDRFTYNLKNFIRLNKAKEQSVFSLFLFGASGIGKTEVARLIASGLQKDTYLAKINFQNYSSQDALNSLIGSPAGYIGCEHGELSDKVKKSKVGILLCDEFEKATRPVFSFFLELLEEGKFTDSMAREYDLDGYILVFTSNIQNEAEYKKIISPELQTRFDLVCEFQEPSYSEKTKFLDLLLDQAFKKFPEQFSKIQMTEEEKQKLYQFDYSELNALRDIKRVFNNRLMDFFTSKGI